MLSKVALVETQKAIESLYDETCNVIEYQKTKVNGVTKFVEVTVLENERCRLSFSNISTINQTDSVAVVTQVVKLFTSPDNVIKTGSKIVIGDEAYKSSGKPAIYDTHQEIVLAPFDKWS